MSIRKMTESEAIATLNALHRNAPVGTILSASEKDSPSCSQHTRKDNLFDQTLADGECTWDHVLIACFEWGPAIHGVVLDSGRHVPIVQPIYE